MAPPLTPSVLAELFDALAFAAHKHRDQRRKNAGASPYINHPIDLARILTVEAHVTDLTVLKAAILHDTIEDTATTADELEARFGREVMLVVCEVTDDKRLPKTERKRLQIVHASGLSTAARLVKLADKIANLRDVADDPPKDWPLQRRQDYFDWARDVVAGLRGTHPRLEALFDAVYAQRPAA